MSHFNLEDQREHVVLNCLNTQINKTITPNQHCFRIVILESNFSVKMKHTYKMVKCDV